MYSTLFLLLLLAFASWYLTSRQHKPPLAADLARFQPHARRLRAAGMGLLAGTALAAALWLGPMTGLSVWLVGLMGVGGLVVALAPLGYLRPAPVAALYIVCLGLEILL